MKKYLWRAVGVVAILYLALVAVRTVHFYNQAKTDAAVAKIQATKLTLDDVMGKNLSILLSSTATTSRAQYDATIQGLDANKNGIRDDVELAIFKAYPHSARTRAVLLQYALALQMEFTQPIVNTDTVTAVVESGERAYTCVGTILSRSDLPKFIEESNKLRSFVESKQIDNDLRKKTQSEFYELLGSHTMSDGSCDLDSSILSS